MNVRKNIDYSDMFAALDTLMAANLPQVEMYHEIGRLGSVTDRKKAQQIASAAHLSLDLAEETCYTEENNSAGEVPGYEETASSQCNGTGSSGTDDLARLIR